MTPVILSHEYHPSGKGGISQHVRNLANSIAATNPWFSVHVITNDTNLRGESRENEATIHRVSAWIDGNNFLNWALVMNAELIREASVLNRNSGISLLHAHDWMTVPAALTLKLAHGLPFALTVHSTENSRCAGIRSEYSHAIESIEDQGVHEAAFVIVNDEATRQEILRDFGIVSRKVKVVEPFGRSWAEEISWIYETIISECDHS